MSKTYEFNYGQKATVNVGNYENFSPIFNIKSIIDNAETITEADAREEFRQMKNLVNELLQQEIDRIKGKKKEEILGDNWFYEKEGKRYVRVTKIITPIPPDIPNLELYGLRGTLLHKIFEKMVTTGEYFWDISDAEKEKLKVIGDIDKFHFHWMLENDRFDFRNGATKVFNDKYLYAGEYDALGFYDGTKVIFDLKSGRLDKNAIEKAFMQMAAYNGALEEKVDGLVILPINPSSKPMPIVSMETDKYFQMFLVKREEFKQKYGV